MNKGNVGQTTNSNCYIITGRVQAMQRKIRNPIRDKNRKSAKQTEKLPNHTKSTLPRGETAGKRSLHDRESTNYPPLRQESGSLGGVKTCANQNG